MSEQQPGLRFDIYERVHLPEEVSAIYELDEVELTPQIRVAVEGDQAIVKGCLLLVGTYSGQADGDSRETKSLEHTIPVEITLPINRIRSVDDISVDIENFDIDLLSPRSLNVTGVLTLNGIEMLSGNSAAWQDEEEVLFVHEPARADESSIPVWVTEATDRTEQLASAEPQPEIESQEEAEPSKEAELKEQNEPQEEAEPQGKTGWHGIGGQPDRTEAQPTATVAASYKTEKKRDELPEGNFEDYEALAQYDNDSAEANKTTGATESAEALEASVPEDPDKGEMKIAFGSKKPDGGQPFDLKSYLSKSDEYRNPSPPAHASQSTGRQGRGFRSEPVPEPVAETGANDVLEWKNLFLSANEEQQFRKVRLCIVHKDDTVESIAKKYDRKPQEIRLYNSLSDQEVTEGQVIYIP
ncbi:LysM peptidoglycan-binding domain-containing protein [Paenibacillus hemerocallicola]|uniref:LysM peptidoglycan-binding domain-containing protein n=1 Tax=Paenibacillus hemerocallicola TaxID=1172614 RepID=A0A5C4TBZ6_9BACL|nr:LysM peptidoglycan-binding domain-containing protein [Paenibacillus hemerocallicola]TNJ66461.1 LysM peptidoglycan-binding domain-containing protein [Paenibacillus hemerocallicola]